MSNVIFFTDMKGYIIHDQNSQRNIDMLTKMARQELNGSTFISAPAQIIVKRKTMLTQMLERDVPRIRLNNLYMGQEKNKTPKNLTCKCMKLDDN